MPNDSIEVRELGCPIEYSFDVFRACDERGRITSAPCRIFNLEIDAADPFDGFDHLLD